MPELVLRSSATDSLILSTSFKSVCLVCPVGLLLAAATIPLLEPEHLAWVLANIE